MTRWSRPRRRQIMISLSVLLVLLRLFIPSAVLGASHYEADGSIRLAEESLSVAFKTVLGAEAAGANVSALIVRLNEAAGLLSGAEVQVKNGGFSEAIGLAGRSAKIAEDVRDEALGLRSSALVYRDFVFKVSLIGSVVGVSVFLVFMWSLWRWFKGYYARRVLGLRPEVATNVDA